VRLALLTDDWQPTGGVASYLRLVAPALARAGHDVLVLHAGQHHSADQPAGITVRGIVGAFRDLGSTANAAATAQVTEALRDFGADLAHIHANDNFPLAGAVRAMLPTVKTIHSLDLCPAGSKFHFATGDTCTYVTGAMCLPRQVYLRCTLSKRPGIIWWQYQRTIAGNEDLRKYSTVTTASEYIKQLAVTNGVAEDRLSVIPYYTPCPDEVTSVSGRSVLFVGRLTPEKGLDLLLDAMTRVPGAWHLNVVGDGISMAAERARVATMKLSERVTFHGWLRGDALASAYRDAAVVVVPSRWPEPFGIVGIEAMAAARPVVAFGVGGIPEWLVTGEGGVLVAPQAVDQLAEGISRCLDDQVEANRMALRGRERVKDEFSEAHHLSRLLPLYERVRGLRR
jgi:glycosyltransferase involved in cell wall biosynthesis